MALQTGVVIFLGVRDALEANPFVAAGGRFRARALVCGLGAGAGLQRSRENRGLEDGLVAG
jgi:hypothetical protein